MSRYGENSQDIDLVWRLHDNGKSQYQIALALRIPRTSVQDILNRGKPKSVSERPMALQFPGPKPLPLEVAQPLGHLREFIAQGHGVRFQDVNDEDFGPEEEVAIRVNFVNEIIDEKGQWKW